MAKKVVRKKPKAKPSLPSGLRFSEEGRIGIVTLARPDRLNALTFEIYAALRDLFKGFSNRRDLRAIILTGEGPGFCSGGDVEDIIAHLLKMKPPELAEFTKMTCDVVANMRSCPQPIVAAINGTVAGAGAALAVACDVRIAVPEAKISFLFVRAGLSSADMGASMLLPRIIGLGRACELLLTGDFIEASTAADWGLYNRVIPARHLMAEAREVAQKIADGPRAGIIASKRTIDKELTMSLPQALRWDALLQARLMRNPDFKEAYQAFKEKRPPRFP